MKRICFALLVSGLSLHAAAGAASAQLKFPKLPELPKPSLPKIPTPPLPPLPNPVEKAKELDPFNKNSAAARVTREHDPFNKNSAASQGPRDHDPFNKNGIAGGISGIGNSNVLKQEYGKWLGEKNEPAEHIPEKTPRRPDQLEFWALDLIRKGRLPQPIDATDYAAMLHDIRLKWARDHVNGSLKFSSFHPVIKTINAQAVAEFSAAAGHPKNSLMGREYAKAAAALFSQLAEKVN